MQADAQRFGFKWASSMGGKDGEHPVAIAVDASGNVLTTGYFNDTADFDPGPNTYNLIARNSSLNMFVSKLDSDGHFVWARQIAATGFTVGWGITTDKAGAVYFTGYFQGSVDFDPGPGVFTMNGGSSSDAFVCKLDAAGNFVWAKKMGGSGGDVGRSIALDASGNIITTGYFRNTADFDPGTGVANLTSAGSDDIFISKLDTGGNFIWARRIGADTADRGNALALDAAGNIYLTGEFRNTVDFDPGSGMLNLTAAGKSDAFVLKLDSAGNLAWARAMGSDSLDAGLAISLDPSGAVYTSGVFSHTADFDPGAGTATLTAVDRFQYYVSKLDASGNYLWAEPAGAGHTNALPFSGVAADATGVWLTADFEGTNDFDPGTNTINLTSNGRHDAFLLRLDGIGNYVSVRQWGAGNDDLGNALCMDNVGNVFITGPYQDTVDFDPDTTTVNLMSNGSAWDVYVLKLGNISPDQTGLKPVIGGVDFGIYPNPSYGTFIIHSAEAMSIRITDMQGRILHDERLNAGQTRVTLKDVLPGHYILQASTEHGSSARILTIQ